jgi:hypothetical protein
VLVSCFDSPEFGNTPHIEFKSVYFGLAPTPNQTDSLVIELDFEDGDGDLGLNDEFRNDIFHEYAVYFQQNNQIVDSAYKFYPIDASEAGFIDVGPDVEGTLVKLGDIPGETDDCVDKYNDPQYRQQTLFFKPGAENVLQGYTIEEVDGLLKVQGQFRVKENKFNKNIFVTFYKNGAAYQWDCEQNFDGRFTVLSEDSSPLSGTMRYTMSTFELANTMGNPSDVWYLEIQIADRSRKLSNVVRTRSFTLAEITRS